LEAEQVPEINTTIRFLRNKIYRHSTCCFPWQFPGYNSGFEPFNNKIGYHFVDIKFFHESLPLPCGLILAIPLVAGRVLARLLNFGTPQIEPRRISTRAEPLKEFQKRVYIPLCVPAGEITLPGFKRSERKGVYRGDRKNPSSGNQRKDRFNFF